jgi:CheY-like chemotaxis protein
MKKILIADEEMWYMEAVMDRIDYEYGKNHYDFVYNGNDAIELLKKNKYSLFVLDMMMPLGGNLELPEKEPYLMYGIYILRLIRKLNINVPIVCYTILEDNGIKKQIDELNAIHICKLDDDAYDNLFKQINKSLR